jgi:hypothetical protein
MQFVSAYRNKIKRHDASKELRNMILFSNFVVSPILDDGQGNGEENLISRSEQKDKHPKAWKIDSSNKKNEKNIFLQESSYQSAYHKTHGKKLNLASDLDLKDRLAIYKNYLQYCITGDVAKLGLGSTIALEKNQKEFAYLKKLGDILGLSDLDIANTHQNIAETAFKMQVNQIIAKGDFNLSKKRMIKDIQKKLGIADANANKIIKSVQSRKVLGNLNKDTLGLDRLLELSEQGNELHTFFAKETRTQMFRRDVEKAMSDGTGNLDIHKFEVIYPEALKLDTAAAREIIKVVALEKLRPTLVQAISFYRQKKISEALNAIHNLASQYRAFPQSVSWEPKSEIEELYLLYFNESNSKKIKPEVTGVLGISLEDAEKLEKKTNIKMSKREKTSDMKDELSYFS